MFQTHYPTPLTFEVLQYYKGYMSECQPGMPLAIRLLPFQDQSTNPLNLLLPAFLEEKPVSPEAISDQNVAPESTQKNQPAEASSTVSHRGEEKSENESTSELGAESETKFEKESEMKPEAGSMTDTKTSE